jgi:hypothetical protein
VLLRLPGWGWFMARVVPTVVAAHCGFGLVHGVGINDVGVVGVAPAQVVLQGGRENGVVGWFEPVIVNVRSGPNWASNGLAHDARRGLPHLAQPRGRLRGVVRGVRGGIDRADRVAPPQSLAPTNGSLTSAFLPQSRTHSHAIEPGRRAHPPAPDPAIDDSRFHPDTANGSSSREWDGWSESAGMHGGRTSSVDRGRSGGESQADVARQVSRVPRLLYSTELGLPRPRQTVLSTPLTHLTTGGQGVVGSNPAVPTA